jgi:hypothetical protein
MPHTSLITKGRELSYETKDSNSMTNRMLIYISSFLAPNIDQMLLIAIVLAGGYAKRLWPP